MILKPPPSSSRGCALTPFGSVDLMAAYASAVTEIVAIYSIKGRGWRPELRKDAINSGSNSPARALTHAAQQAGNAVTSRVLAAIVFLLIPTLASVQNSQTQGKTDLARNEAGKPSPSENKSGNASDGNGAVTPTNMGVDPGSDANATTAPSSKPPIAVRRDAPM